MTIKTISALWHYQITCQMTWVWKRALSSLALSDILPQNWKHSDLAINSWLNKKRLVLHSKVAESFKILFRDEKNVNHVIFEKKHFRNSWQILRSLWSLPTNIIWTPLMRMNGGEASYMMVVYHPLSIERYTVLLHYISVGSIPKSQN